MKQRNGLTKGKAAPVYINPNGNCMQIAGYQYQTTRQLASDRSK